MCFLKKELYISFELEKKKEENVDSKYFDRFLSKLSVYATLKFMKQTMELETETNWKKMYRNGSRNVVLIRTAN